MRYGVERHIGLRGHENKSETNSATIADAPAFVSFDDVFCNQSARLAALCSYVVAEDWHYGAPPPFCDAPAEAGSSYCTAHRALCAVPLGSVAAGRVLAAQAHAADGSGAILPPPPEPLDIDADEALNALDLPRHDETGGEG